MKFLLVSNKKKLLLSFFLFSAGSVFAATEPILLPAPPVINADAYLLVDFDTGTVLAKRNADRRLPPASLTKLMTAYILAQEIESGRLKLTDEVVVSRNSWSQNPVFRGSSLMWIEPGKSVTLAELERGIVISSGNDASVAVAEHIAGSEAAFVDLMNQYAGELGLEGTHFKNSHGLPQKDHVSTARDLAMMASAAIRDHPERYSIYKELTYTYNNIKQYNRNHLLREDPSVDGLKTGYTREAGYGLVASAKREGMRLISVILGSASPSSRKSETRSLFSYGFRFFETRSLLSAGESLAEHRVWEGLEDFISIGTLDPVILTVARKNVGIEVSFEVDDPLIAPLSKGQTVGVISFARSGVVLYEAPLYVLESVSSAGFFTRLWDSIARWFGDF